MKKEVFLILLINYLCFTVFCSNNISLDDFTNTHLEMVEIIAAGRQFEMGSENGENNELPVHTVVFMRDFLLGKTEVTQRDYEALLGINPSKYKGANLPVEKVSWFDAVLFCNALSKNEGFDTVYEYMSIIGIPGDNCKLENLKVKMCVKGYRLPTEAEWEYAYRAGSKTDYYWGSSEAIDTVSMYCWYSRNSEGETHPAGLKLPNANGLYDMGGNLYEWCNDWFGLYSDSVYIDPVGNLFGTSKIIRGGNWLTPTRSCRASYRGYTNPAFRCSAIGFRVARLL